VPVFQSIGHGAQPVVPIGPFDVPIDTSDLLLAARTMGPGGAQPAIEEDWTQYADWTDFENNHPNIYSNFTQMIDHGRGNLDIRDIGGESVLWRRRRHDPAKTAGNPCTDQFGYDVDFKAGVFGTAPNKDAWFEWESRYSANFTTADSNTAPQCLSGKFDHKTLLIVGNDVGSGQDRHDCRIGNSGSNTHAACVGYDQAVAVRIRAGNPWPLGDVSNRKYPPETVRQSDLVTEVEWNDAAWHTFRFAVMYRPDLAPGPGGGVMWQVYAEIDGTLTHSYITEMSETVPFTISSIAFGHNFNCWPDEEMEFYSRRFKAWDINPGWGPGNIVDPTEFYNVSPWSNNQS